MRLAIIIAVACLFTSFAPFAVTAQTTAACSPAKAAEAGKAEFTITVGDLERTYTVYLPTGYDGSTPVPLVLSMHGFASNPDQHALFARWQALGEQESFISVYPRGTGVPLRWNTGTSTEAFGGADDVAFFGAMLDTLMNTYCIDAARVYANGFSNGGGMTNRLACEYADRFAAFGMVGGAYTEVENCTPARGLPIIAFHGQLDPIVNYMGEDSQGLGLPPIEAWAAEWAQRNGCETEMTTVVEPPNPITTREWAGCADDARVILHTLPDGGHTWPGGLELPEFLVGLTRQDLDATALMWDFFQGYALNG